MFKIQPMSATQYPFGSSSLTYDLFQHSGCYDILVSKKKHHESASVYASASDFRWSRKIFRDHSTKCVNINKVNWILSKTCGNHPSVGVSGPRRFFDTIQFAFVNIYISKKFGGHQSFL